jgi:hypothetical protein
MHTSELQSMAVTDLLAVYVGVLGELRERGILRTGNNPVADYTEYLVAKALGLQLATRSSTGHDAQDDCGNRYEIKGRRLTNHNPSRQLSVIRGLQKQHFSYLAGVLFAEDFSVLRACLIPIEVVEHEADYRPHVNGWVLHLRDRLWEHPQVRDITSDVRAAQASAPEAKLQVPMEAEPNRERPSI